MMKKSLYTIFICSLIALGFHFYLSFRSYSLSVDSAEESTVCYISESLNCDNALTSSYSAFAGIPLSDWGFATHLIIALLSLVLLMGWVEKAAPFWFSLFCFSFISAGASLVMIGISVFFLNFFCPFCIILYLLSFIVFIVAFFSAKANLSLSSVKEPRVLVSCLAVWVLASLLLHLIFMNSHDIKSAEKTVKRNVMDWISAPIKSSGEKPLLTVGPPKEESVITITEFADFLCSFCRKSHYLLKKLKSSNPNIRLEYFSFPLDECKSKRASCVLTRAVYCADKQSRGWNMHDLVFEHQKEFISLNDNKQAVQKLQKLSAHLNLDWERWSECIESSVAFEITEKQITAGKNVNITGTPSLFVNEKKVNHGYLTKTIKAIRQHITKSVKGDVKKTPNTAL